MPLVHTLLRWADRLRDLSAAGLRYALNDYDRARYTAIQDISLEMQALAAGELPAEIEPLRLPVLSRPTPYAYADAAIIDVAGRILLVRRADTRDWAIPGGAVEVGETPAEAAVREAWEETGVRCRPLALVGVFDTLRCGAISRYQLFINLFLCALQDGDAPSAVNMLPTLTPGEVLETAWFAEDSLPADLHVGHAMRIRECYRVWHGDVQPYFDE